MIIVHNGADPKLPRRYSAHRARSGSSLPILRYVLPPDGELWWQWHRSLRE